MSGKRGLLVKVLAFLLIFSVLVGPMAAGALADGAREAPLTPAEAVADMTWGVNFPDFFIADAGGYGGSTTGYCETAPFGIGIWFWNNDFDWLMYYQVHDPVSLDVSVNLPNYSDNYTPSWFDSLFKLGVITKTTEQRIVLRLSDSKIIYSNGDVTPLDFIDKTYEGTTSNGPDGNGNCNFFMEFDEAQLPAPGASLNGARFVTTVTIVDASFSSMEAKADQFFELNRIKTDPEELTEIFLEQGINVVRLPVTWTYFVDNETFKIDAVWLEKVQEMVDYFLSKGIYCILNMHNDYLQYSYVVDESGGRWERLWMYPQYSDYVNSRFAAAWTQIAEYFKDYPDKLIFEVCNEPAMYWYESDLTAYPDHFDTQVSKINELNELFVETVRNTGGKNGARLLGIAVANYDNYQYLDRLELPDDDYLIVQLHSYTELEPSGTTYQTATDRLFDAVDKFVKETGIPVMIGELGATHSGVSDFNLASRATYFFTRAKQSGVPCLWWEDSFDAGTYHWLYDKKKHQWGRPLTLKAIKDALGILTVNVNINGSDEWLSCSFDGACTVAAAVYDGEGRMLDCASIDRAAGDSYITLNLAPPQSSGRTGLKVFLLSQDSHAPLAGVLKI